MSKYRIVEHRGKWAVRIGSQRLSLGIDATESNFALAETLAAVRVNSGPGKEQDTIGGYVLSYIKWLDKEGKDADRPREAWESLKGEFANLLPDTITEFACDRYIADRLKSVRPSTVKYEMALMRRALNWAKKRKALKEVPFIKVPPESPPREEWLTREQYASFLGACETPHVYLFVVLAQTTAARHTAILELAWKRVDFQSRVIDFRTVRHTGNKGRAVVPMNPNAEKALRDAYKARQTDFVIEYAGAPIKSIKKALQRISKKTGIHASAHMFRHSAAVWMAQDGISMLEIAKYLGHDDVGTTIKHYIKYSPDYLQQAAGSLTW